MSSEPKPFLPYGRQTISEADIAAVVEVLRSPFLTQGPVVPAFEHAVAAKVGARYGVAVNSATSALHIACTEAEQKSLVFRRSIYVAEDIAEGELFITKNIRIVRPGNGAPPSFYKQILGLQAKRGYRAGTPLILQQLI